MLIMVGNGWLMLIKPATSHTLTQCWYTRAHQPGLKRSRDEDGVFHAYCRHCERPIQSEGGKSWTLSDGIDLDALARASTIRFICVTNVADGMVVARHPIDRDAGDDTVQRILQETVARYEEAGTVAGLDIRVMGGPKGKA